MESRERRILCLTLSLGGGAQVFLQDYVRDAFADAAAVFALRPIPADAFPGKAYYVVDVRDPENHTQIPPGSESLVTAARQLGITEIFVNHLVGFDPGDVQAALAALGLPYTVFVHDYIAICPHFSLDCQMRRCAQAEVAEACRKAFALIGLEAWTLADYRAAMHAILRGARDVLAPTRYAADIVTGVYPDVTIYVRPHRVPFAVARTFDPAFAEASPVTLAMVGAIWERKGASWFYALQRIAKQRNLPVRCVAIGDAVAAPRPGIRYTGHYERQELAQVLARERVAVVLCPSTFPETYCYTASEALLAGYPVLTMNLGAQAVRVQRCDAGWVLPQDTRAAGEAALAHWLRRIVTPAGRQEIKEKAAHTARFVNGMEE